MDVQYTPQETPLTSIGVDIWSFVKASLNEFHHLEQLSECFVRLASRLMDIMPNTFREFLTPYLQIVIQKFDESPYSTYIYAIENSFCRFHKFSPSYDNILLEAFDAIMGRCTRNLVSKEAAFS